MPMAAMISAIFQDAVAVEESRQMREIQLPSLDGILDLALGDSTSWEVDHSCHEESN